MYGAGRKQKAKNTAVDANQQLSLLVQSVVDYAIFMLDPSGIVISWNAGTTRIKGYSADEIIGQHFSRFYTEEDRKSGRPQHALREAERHGRYEAEGWRVRKDGTRLFANVVIDAIRDENGALTGFAKITRDITERMKAQQALIESEHMVRDIIDMSLDAFIQMDEQGSVLEWNAQAGTLFGRPRAEALGQKFNDLIIPAALRAGFWAGLERLVRTGEAPVIGRRLEMDALRRDGQKIKIELAITVLRRREGYVFNAFIRDLTEKDAIEAQLRQAQKLEALGQLTGGVAHDFNNLLTVVVGNLEMLLRRLKTVAAAGGDLDMPANAALRAANRAAMLTRQLLAFSRQQTLQPRPTDLAALARTTVALLRRTLGEGIAIETRLGNDIRSVVVDPNQLENALLNLALNARDAMPDGGRLVFEVANMTTERIPRALPEDVPPGDYVIISVSDTGIGMSDDVLTHVFEPFFTTKEVGKGSGLGLSQVYGFMQQSGGRVAIASMPGEGTTVSLFLPYGNAAEAPSDMAPRVRVPEAGREKILVVEDDNDVRRFTTGTLRELGYYVIEASQGDEALRLLERHRDIRLLFSDIGLPGRMNGRQLAEEAMRRADGLRVLFTSGYAEAALVEKGRLVPGVELICKPFTYADLGTKVRQVLDASKSG
jgi:PAS domain S-box-containing protein